LAVATALLCLGVLTAAGAAVYLGARHSLSANLDGALLTIAQTEVASALDGPEGTVHVHEEGPSPLHLPIGSGYEKFAQIEDEEDDVMAATTNLRVGPELSTDPDAKTRARMGEVTFATVRRDGQRYRAVYYPLRDRTGRPLLAIVALPMRPMQDALRLLLGVLALVLTLGSALAAWGASAVARRLTGPLEEIAVAARTVGETNLHARIPDVAADVELRDVAAVLNAMLARLETAFEARQQLIAAQRRFIADASHELRSPLSNLRGTVEVALRRPRSPDDYHETLATAQAEIVRMCRLVEDLLMLSRADAGQFALDEAPCDLARIAQEAVAAHRASAGQAGVRLSAETAARVAVRGDADRLRQVADNLLDNAIRYAPPGSAVSVTARLEGAEARLSVEDRGPGLAAEEQSHVFDRFYRADRSRSRRSGGLGLGLAIAKTIADAHHGHLTVRSAPGQGATFTLTLPALLSLGNDRPDTATPPATRTPERLSARAPDSYGTGAP
jgi:two-component system OmpR family sensor kinase